MKRVIGVEGLENSGKSDILRKLAKDLIFRGGKVKSVYRYGRLNQACDASILDGDDDFVIVIEIDGAVIVIVSLGDYENIVRRIKDLLKRIGVDPDILIVAMRMASPNVSAVYRQEYGKLLDVIFKPGIKRWENLTYDQKEFLDELWLKMIKDAVAAVMK